MFFLVERNAVFKVQTLPRMACKRAATVSGIDRVQVLAFQAEQRSAAVAFTGGAQRPYNSTLTQSGRGQQCFTAQAFVKARGGANRSDGVGGWKGRYQCEQVEPLNDMGFSGFLVIRESTAILGRPRSCRGWLASDGSVSGNMCVG